MYLRFPNGLIEVITGPMFSGKSEELIKRIKILQYAKIKTLVVKPKIEKRWNKDAIFSRAGTSIETISVDNARQIMEKWTPAFRAVAIDEAQFFDAEIVKVVVKLADQGVRVVISGLDKNYLAQPFGVMPTLLAISDKVDKLIAVCVICGAAATLTFRLKGGKELIQIGDKEYEARCRHCYRLGMEDKNENC
ncbi:MULTISPECIES: thymidine kinase [unclassified Mycoplasma]